MDFERKEPCTDPFILELISKVKACLREKPDSVCFIIIDDLNEEELKNFLKDGRLPGIET